MKIIKIPFSGSLGKANGSELAPDLIIKELHDLLSNEAGRKCGYLVEEIKISSKNIEETHNNICNKIKEEKEGCIILGGGHSITSPCFKAFSETHENSGIIIFDAHPDCRDNFTPALQEDLVNGIVNKKLVSPKNIILIGTRNWHNEELEFIKKNNIRVFSMKQLFDMGVKEICDTIMETARSWSSLYISIDIDSVDPAFAPGTGCTEPAGLTSRELIYFVQRLKLLKNLKIVDIVEINPKKDVNNMTSKLGAKIIAEFC